MFICRANTPPKNDTEDFQKLKDLLKYVKMKTKENKSRFGKEKKYQQFFKFLVKKQASLSTATGSCSRAATSSEFDAGRGVDCFPMPDQSSQQGCADDAARDRVLPGPEICSPLSSGRSLSSHGDGALLHGRRVGQLSDSRTRKSVRESGKKTLPCLISASSTSRYIIYASNGLILIFVHEK